VASYELKKADTAAADFAIKLKVKLNNNGITSLEEYLLEESKEVKEEKKEGQEEQKSKKVTTNVPCKFLPSTNYSYSKVQIEKFFEEEAKMKNHDSFVNETYEKKNLFESYIYNCRRNCGEKYLTYSTPDICQNLLSQLTEAEEWLYEAGNSAQKSAYTSRLEVFKKVTDPIDKRIYENEVVPELFTRFKEGIEYYEKLAASTDPKYEHITEEERAPIVKLVNDGKVWLEKM